MAEIWKDIKGYEGRYQISNLGHVKSLERYIKHGKITGKFPEKIIKPSLSTSGYEQICLSIEGKQKTLQIHSLVALYFVEGYKKGLEVNHKDGNKRNNFFSNLEWCTKQENKEHSVKIGTNARGERHASAKLTEKKVLSIRKLFSEKRYSKQKLASLFSVSISSIQDILCRRTWKYM